MYRIIHHYEFANMYELLKVWCLNGSFKFNDVDTNEIMLSLMDIFGMVVDDVCGETMH